MAGARWLGLKTLSAVALGALVILVAVTLGMVGVAGAQSSGHAKAKTVKVSTMTIKHVGTVLTTSSGLTLYRFTEDPVGRSTCTGACAKEWPPLTAARGAHVAGPKGVKGLSVIDVGHGRWQVALHRVALYRFAGDAKKGQANGQGIGHSWFAVLKSGIPAAAGTTSAGSTAATSTTAPGSSTTQPVSSTQSSGGTVTPTAPASGTTPAVPAPTPTTTPVTAPPSTQPPTTTPPTQPPSTTTTMASGGYGY